MDTLYYTLTIGDAQIITLADVPFKVNSSVPENSKFVSLSSAETVLKMAGYTVLGVKDGTIYCYKEAELVTKDATTEGESDGDSLEPHGITF